MILAIWLIRNRTCYPALRKKRIKILTNGLLILISKHVCHFPYATRFRAIFDDFLLDSFFINWWNRTFNWWNPFSFTFQVKSIIRYRDSYRIVRKLKSLFSIFFDDSWNTTSRFFTDVKLKEYDVLLLIVTLKSYQTLGKF